MLSRTLSRFESLYKLCSLALICELALIPSSQLTILKVLTIIALSILLTYGLSANKLSPPSGAIAIFLLGTFLLLGSFLIGMLQYSINVAVSFRALSSYLGIPLGFLVLAAAAKNNLIQRGQTLKIFIISVTLYVILKSILMAFPLLGIMPVRDVQTLLGAGMALDFRSEDALFLRIATGNDWLIVFSIYFLLFHDEYCFKFRKSIHAPVLTILILGSILTFTRFIWLASIFVLFAFIVKRKLILKSIALFGLLFVGFYFVDSHYQIGLVKESFTRLTDSASVDKKNEQAVILIDETKNFILLGKGVGSYVNSYIRSDYLPFQYETQWISLWLQLGTFEIIIVIIIFLLPVKRFIKNSLNLYIDSITFTLTILYSLFLLSAFTNPNLFILTSILIYFLVSAYFPERPRKSFDLMHNNKK